jgi:hypothetical protein
MVKESAGTVARHSPAALGPTRQPIVLLRSELAAVGAGGVADDVRLLRVIMLLRSAWVRLRLAQYM